MIVISYVDISCTGGQPGVTNGGTLGVTAGNIIMNTGSGTVDITAANTYLRNTVHIDVPGDNGSSLFLYGSKTIDSGIPAVELHASNGTTRDTGNLDVYATRSTFHGDVFIDLVSNGNLFLGATTTSGNGFAMMRFYADASPPKLGILWSGVWWWFTPSSNSHA